MPVNSDLRWQKAVFLSRVRCVNEMCHESTVELGVERKDGVIQGKTSQAEMVFSVDFSDFWINDIYNVCLLQGTLQ